MYVDTAVSGRGHFQDFRLGFRFSHIRNVDRHGHFTLKQLRLPVVNESHTNSYTGPRLSYLAGIFLLSKVVNCFVQLNSSALSAREQVPHSDAN